MRRTIVVLAFIIVVLYPSVALAEGSPAWCTSSRTGEPLTPEDILHCLGESLNASPGSSSTPATSSDSNTKYVAYNHLATGSDGQPCVTTGWRPEGTRPTDEAPSYIPDGGPSLGTEDNSNLYHTYPPCPQQDGQPAPNPDTPASIAARFWEREPLPVPRPEIAPGWAITGKLAYLETNGELRHTYTSETPFGPLEIQAIGEYYVDWGDGESSGPHSNEGRPWPNGTITHEYEWAGTYKIVLTEHWTATWRIGTNSGTLRELRTTGRINDFPARQIQAVLR